MREKAQMHALFLLLTAGVSRFAVLRFAHLERKKTQADQF